jgi:MFS family permease
VTLYVLTLFSVLNHSAYVGSRVAVALLAIHLQASPLTVGTLMSLYGVLPMLFSVSVGRLSDRAGPRLPMLVGSILVVCGALLAFAVPGVTTLYFAAALIGSGFMMFQVTMQNIVGFIGKPEQRPANFAMVAVGFSISAFIGPMVTGLAIDWFGHVSAFLVLAALPVATVIALAANKLPLPRLPTQGKRQGERRVADLLSHRDLRRVFMISGMQAMAWELFSFMVPVYGASIGLSASMIGVIMASFATATFTIRMALPYLSRRVTAWRLLHLALLTAGIAYSMFPLAHSAVPLMVLAFLLGLGLGSAQPMVMALLHDVVPEGRTGEAVGIRSTVITTGQTVMPLVYGALGTAVGFPVVFWTVAVALAAGSQIARKRKKL